jgi:protein-L-isoaspartate O-methyltransferase
MAMDSVRTYYQRRAPEYDAVYNKPERQDDISKLAVRLTTLFAGRTVLEVAAGTGYWTQILAASAGHVLATDVNGGPLQIAKERDFARASVDFELADAFRLGAVAGDFDALFAGFWWSHLAIAQQSEWLRQVADRLPPGALVAFIDNRFVEGSSHPISRQDFDGNTYQSRTLADGSTWEVLKNFPSTQELVTAVDRYAESANVEELDYYWLLRYTLRHHG